MTQPRSLRFPGRKARGTIRYVRNPVINGVKADAYCDPETRRTVISSTLSPEKQAAALLHECLHHAMKPTRDAGRHADLDETIADTISLNLTDLWQANPEVFEWIHKHLTGQADG